MPIDYGPLLRAKGQEAHRKTVYFRDDFDRTYETVIDTRTLSSCGPKMPRFKAPLHVPPQYLRERPDTPLRFFIDWDGWIAENRGAHGRYRDAAHALAKEMFPNNYAQAVQTPEQFPALVHALGDPPLSERFIRALRVGNPWLTGVAPGLDPHLWFSDLELDALERLKARSPMPTAAEIASDIEEFSGTIRAPHQRRDPREQFPEDAEEFAAVASAVNLGTREYMAAVYQRAQAVPPPPPAQSYNEFMAEQRKLGKSMQEIGALWKEQKAGRVPAGV